MPVIRVFISSPGDVEEERDRARQVVEGLRRRYAGRFDLQPVLWEQLPLQADLSFQQGIDLVLSAEHGIDIAVFILWSRLGSPLGALVCKEDGTPYRSGTEREFDLMMRAREQSGGERPAILVYTRQDETSFDERLRGRSTSEKELSITQKKLVEAFIAEEFHDARTGYNVRAYHSFDRPVTFSQRLREHLMALLDAWAGGARTEIRWDIGDPKQGAPYLGLAAFQPQHADIFAGRELETLEARNRLLQQARQGCAFLLLSGASGSGKSSLARAGVLPAVIENEIDADVSAWRSVIVTPQELGADPVAGLAARLAAADVLPELHGEAESLEPFIELLRTQPQAAVRLRAADAFARAARRLRGGLRILLVLDQLEELFASAGVEKAVRESFLCAVEALARSGRIWVLATIRSDFSLSALSDPALARMAEGGGILPVLAPETDALRRMIVEPAEAAGLQFEMRNGENLADRILRDSAGRAELLPLLEFVLEKLFAARSPDRYLLWEVYESLGGVEGALANRAEQVLASLPPENQAALDPVLSALVTIGRSTSEAAAGDGQIVRSRALMADVRAIPGAAPLLDAFVKERLLITSGGGAGGAAAVTLAHESLMRVWPRAVEWAQRNRDFLLTRARVAARMEEGSPLLEGDPLLAAAARYLAGPGYSAELRAFVVRSQADVNSRHRRRERLRRNVTAALAALAVLSLGAAAWAWIKQREATDKGALAAQQSKLAAVQSGRAAREAATAKRELSRADFLRAAQHIEAGNPGHGLAFLARALRDDPSNAAASSRLLSLLTQRDWSLPCSPVINHGAPITGGGFLGTRWVYSSEDRLIKVWEISSGRMAAMVECTQDIFAVNEEGGGRLWVAHTYPLPWEEQGAGAPSAGKKPGFVLRSYSLETGQASKEIYPVESGAGDIKFDAAGAAALVIGDDWSSAYGLTLNSATGAVTRTGLSALPAELSESMRVTENPEAGIDIVSFDQNGQKRLRTTGTQKVQVLAYAPSGDHVVVALTPPAPADPSQPPRAPFSDTENVELWSPQGEYAPVRLNQEWLRSMGLSDGVDIDFSNIAFSKDGRYLLAGASAHGRRPSNWSTVLIKIPALLADQSRNPWQHLGSGFGLLNKVSFDPHQLRVIASSDYAKARRWHVDHKEIEAAPLEMESRIVASEYSSGGAKVMTASRDGRLKVWRDADRLRAALPSSLPGELDRLTDVSSDGEWAVYRTEGGVRIFHTGTWEPAGPPIPLADRAVSAAISRDRAAAVFVTRSNIEKWNLREWRKEGSQPLSGLKAGSAAFTRDHQIALAVQAGDRLQVLVWDDALSRSPQIVDLGDRISSAALSPAGSHAVVFRSPANDVSDPETGEPPENRDSDTGDVMDVCELWDIAARKQLNVPSLALRGACGAAFSPDGTRLAAGFLNGDAFVMNTAAGEIISPKLTHSGPVRTLEFSSSGALLATAASWEIAAAEVRVWTAAGGRPRTAVIHQEDSVVSLRFDRTESRLLVCSHHSICSIYDIETTREVVDYFEPAAPWFDLSNRIVSGAKVLDLGLIDGDAPDWLPALAESIGGFRLREEGAPYLIDDPAVVLDSVRAQLQTAPPDEFTNWGRWFLDSSLNRKVAPSAKETQREHIAALLQENGDESRRDPEESRRDAELISGMKREEFLKNSAR